MKLDFSRPVAEFAATGKVRGNEPVSTLEREEVLDRCTKLLLIISVLNGCPVVASLSTDLVVAAKLAKGISFSQIGGRYRRNEYVLGLIPGVGWHAAIAGKPAPTVGLRGVW